MVPIITVTSWGKTWAHQFGITGCTKCERISSGVIGMLDGRFHTTQKDADEQTKEEHRAARAAINAFRVKCAEAGR